MMKYSNQGEIDAFLKLTESPAGRRYWVEQKRVIMYNIFKAEIFDRTLPLTTNKVRKAISQLGETHNPPTEARIRAFIYRIRKERPENSEIPDVEYNAVPSTTITPNNLTSHEYKTEGRYRRLYWTEDRRRIIYKLFRREMLDLDLRITNNKLIQAINQLGEESSPRNVSRIRTFALSIRKQRKQKIDAGKPVTPLPSDSESDDEDMKTKSDYVAQSLNINGKDSEKTSQDESRTNRQETEVDSEFLNGDAEDFGNVNGSESNNCKEMNVDPGLLNGNCISLENFNQVASNNIKEETESDPIIESVEENTSNLENIDECKLESGEKEPQLDPVEQLSDENGLDAENNVHDTSENAEEQKTYDPAELSSTESDTDSESYQRTLENNKERMEFDRVEQPLNENGTDAEDSNEDALEIDEEEMTVDPTVQSLTKNDINSENDNEGTSENSIEESKYDPVMDSSNENKTDSEDITELPRSTERSLDSSDCDVAITKNELEETKISPDDIQSLDDDTISKTLNVSEVLGSPKRSADSNESSLENGTEEMKVDAVIQSSNENDENFGIKIKVSVSPKRSIESGDNNKACISPKRRKTQWTAEMTSTTKNHFAQELFNSNWPAQTSKVDLVTNFLKCNGFDNITSETIFNWANYNLKELNDSSEPLFDRITGFLVAAVMNGSFDLESISQNELSLIPSKNLNTEESNTTNNISSKSSPLKVLIAENSSNYADIIELPPKEQEVINDSMPNGEEIAS